MPRLAVITAGTLAAVAAAVVPAAPAAAAAPGCGSVVTGTVVLQADITGCAGDGLVVGASNTRINLNGHTISGLNAPGSVGIRINGHNDVVIRSSAPFGAVAEFDVAIRAVNTRRFSVSDISTGAVRFGLRLEQSRNATIRHNNLGFAELVPDCDPATAPAAIRLVGTQGSTIQNNAAQLSGYGILLIRSHENTVTGNGAAPNGSDGNSCSGIALVDSDRNVVTENDATENRGVGPGAGDGIVVDAASGGNVIQANRASTNSDDGIDIRRPGTRVVKNTATANDDLGIEAVVGVIANGNRASGNGNPAQCVGVYCTP